jgi:hypothetical protein
MCCCRNNHTESDRRSRLDRDVREVIYLTRVLDSAVGFELDLSTAKIDVRTKPATGRVEPIYPKNSPAYRRRYKRRAADLVEQNGTSDGPEVSDHRMILA